MIRTTQQLDFIRECLRAGASHLSQASTGSVMSPSSEIEVLEVASCAIGDLDDDILFGDGDLVAGVSSSLRGSLFGTALFAMEPEDAFAWVLSGGSGSDPLANFVAGGEEVLRGLIEATGVSLGAPAELGEPVLREDTLINILFETHAPSDTLLVSARLMLRSSNLTLPASFYLLLAPKQLGQLTADSVSAAEA